MSTSTITTVPVTAARRACVALELRLLALREGDRGQGTVEYVALILLVGAILTAVVGAGHRHFDIATTIGNKLKDTINTVGDGK